MPANTLPSFSRAAKIGRVVVTAANASSQGGGTIGTNIFLAFTAHATNGSYIDFVRWIPVQISPGSPGTFTVGRIFISSIASGTTTSADTFLFQEVQLQTVTSDPTYTADVPMGIVIDPGYTILVTNHGAPASNNNWSAVVVGGDL